MTGPADHIDADPDRRYRAWMRELLDRAAQRFGVALDGPVVFG